MFVGTLVQFAETVGLVQFSVLNVSRPDTANVPVHAAPVVVVALKVNVPEKVPLAVVLPETVPLAVPMPQVPLTDAPACVSTSAIARVLCVLVMDVVYCIVPDHVPATLAGGEGAAGELPPHP